MCIDKVKRIPFDFRLTLSSFMCAGQEGCMQYLSLNTAFFWAFVHMALSYIQKLVLLHFIVLF